MENFQIPHSENVISFTKVALQGLSELESAGLPKIGPFDARAFGFSTRITVRVFDCEFEGMNFDKINSLSQSVGIS